MVASINAVKYGLADLREELGSKDKQRAARDQQQASRDKQQALENELRQSEIVALKSNVDNLRVAALAFESDHQVHHSFRIQQESTNAATTLSINKLKRDLVIQEHARGALQDEERDHSLRILELEAELAVEKDARIALEAKMTSMEKAVGALETESVLQKRSTAMLGRRIDHGLTVEKDSRLALEADVSALERGQALNKRSINMVGQQLIAANDSVDETQQALATLRGNVARMNKDHNELRQFRTSFIDKRIAQATIIGNLNVVMRRGDVIENKRPKLSYQITAKLSDCDTVSRLDNLLGTESVSQFRQVFSFPQTTLADVYRFTRVHLQRSSGGEIVTEGADSVCFREWVESEAVSESMLLHATIDVVVTTDAAVAARWRGEGKSVAQGLDDASVTTSDVLSFI
jgi:hypothetical protein